MIRRNAAVQGAKKNISHVQLVAEQADVEKRKLTTGPMKPIVMGKIMGELPDEKVKEEGQEVLSGPEKKCGSAATEMQCGLKRMDRDDLTSRFSTIFGC